MKIAVVAWGSFTRPAGTELCHLDLCRGLARRGHEVFLLYETPGPLLEEWRTFTVGDAQLEGYARGIRATLRAPRALVGLLSGARTIWRWAPDCVYLNFPADTALGLLAAFPSRAPVVCHLHLPYTQGGSKLFRITFDRVARFVAVSDSVLHDWLRFPLDESRVRVVRNGVDLERFFVLEDEAHRTRLRLELGIPPRLPVVLFLGRIAREKGLHVLLEAVEQLRAAGREFHVVVAGMEQEPDYAAAMRTRSTGLPVSWLAWRSDVQGLYQAADVVALPSIWPEPLGLVTLEAFASGTPVVASKVGGVPEVLKGAMARFLVEAGDPTALALRLGQLLDWRSADPKLARELRRYAESNFGLEKTAAELEAVLREVVPGPGPSGRRSTRPFRALSSGHL